MKYIKNSLNLRGLFNGVAISLSSWAYLIVAIFSNPQMKLSSSRGNMSIFLLFAFVSICSFLFTWNYTVLVQVFAFYFFQNMVSDNGEITINLRKSLVKYLRVYLFVGFLYASHVYLQGKKTGLFGVELNFTGYIILVYLFVIKSLGRLKIIDFVIWISFIFFTESRAFLIMSIIACVLYTLRNRVIALNFILILFVGIFFYFEGLVEYLDYFLLFKQTGYVDDYTRLYQFYDSSSIARYDIGKEYLGHFKSDVASFLLGNKYSVGGKFLMEAHNSIFQKIYDYGVVATAILIYIIRRRLEPWLFTFLIIYSFFLHNLLSIPLLIFISLYGQKFDHYSSDV